MEFADEKYILLTTYRRSGEAVPTPVWVVALDGGDVGFWTSSMSGKVKRMAHTAAVTVQPCDARGKVRDGSGVVHATARVVVGPELEAIRAKVVAKYGLMTKAAKLLAGAVDTFKRRGRRPYGDAGVVLTVG